MKKIILWLAKIFNVDLVIEKIIIKEVIKEIPVEKIVVKEVIKEVPIEVIKEVEVIKEIYKGEKQITLQDTIDGDVTVKGNLVVNGHLTVKGEVTAYSILSESQKSK